MSYGKQAIFFLVVSALLSPSFAAAFGISPPAITADKLLKGSRYEATIFLVRADKEADLLVEAQLRVSEKIKDWITLDSGLSFVIPAGVRQFPVKVLVNVPQDAELNIYDGSISFNALEKQEKETGDQNVVITVAVGLGLHLVVGEGVFADFTIRNVDILDVKEGEPPQIVVTLENTGNVPIAPERATFDLFDKFGQVRLGFGQTETLPETPPFETKRFVVEFPIDIKLGLGEYWAEAKIYRGQSVVGEIKTVFNVLEKKLSLGIIIIIIAALLLGGFVFLFIRRRIKKALLSPGADFSNVSLRQSENKTKRKTRKK